MTTEEEFAEYLESIRPALQAWGDYVSEIVKHEISNRLGALSPQFLKIDATPRVKAVNSALNKISIKQYDDPKTQMTDLVGVRFVVLTTDDLCLVEKIIEHQDWGWEVSKDFALDIEVSPKVFDYQSKHYEVRPKRELNVGGVRVPDFICCEVQVRTLLQHAYAELVHDNIYKAKGVVPPSAERYVSRSMALMETTDEIFCTALQKLQAENYKRDSVIKVLEKVFSEDFGLQVDDPDRQLHFAVLESYADAVEEFSSERLRDIFEKKKFIRHFVEDRYGEFYFFRQPIVLFVYYVISVCGMTYFWSNWPLSVYNKEVKYVANDLGESFTPHGR
ncbi:MAG: GTP pyrophosphokinase [Pseudomonadota bacterium]